MHPYVRANQELWEEWTEINYRSAYYDVEGFRAKAPPLDAIVRSGLGDLTGKSVLHLQCHFGLDTMRIAKVAREVTGVDFSARAIGYARRLAGELGIAARFVESDLYALRSVLEGEFDVVFTSWGVINWLPDLLRWGEVVARYLRPGGTFFIADNHPTLWLFDPKSDELKVTYSYFHQVEPTATPPTLGNYADPTATVTKTEYTWSHGLGEIVMALVHAGLRIDDLREHARLPWRALSFLVEDQDGLWTMPSDRIAIPLSFSLRATGP